MTYTVTLKGRAGFTRTFKIEHANDEWHARRLALRRNVSEGGPAAWCHQVSR